MTTDGPPGPLYPDFRTEAQRRSDGRIAAAQSQALDNSNADPRGANALINRLLAERERAQGSDKPPSLIDVIWPEQSGEQHPILVARDQLLLRNPAGPRPGWTARDRRSAKQVHDHGRVDAVVPGPPQRLRPVDPLGRDGQIGHCSSVPASDAASASTLSLLALSTVAIF